MILGRMVLKGTLLVMPTSSSYEDASNPMHTLGPITGEAPPLHPLVSDVKHPSSFEDSDDVSEGKGDKIVGQWKAGTGRMFDPERWLKEGIFDANAGPSLPFSLGQRGCFGKSLAVRPHLHLILRVLVLKLTLGAVDGIKDVHDHSQSSFLLCAR